MTNWDDATETEREARAAFEQHLLLERRPSLREGARAVFDCWEVANSAALTRQAEAALAEANATLKRQEVAHHKEVQEQTLKLKAQLDEISEAWDDLVYGGEGAMTRMTAAIDAARKDGK